MRYKYNYTGPPQLPNNQAMYSPYIQMSIWEKGKMDEPAAVGLQVSSTVWELSL